MLLSKTDSLGVERALLSRKKENSWVIDAQQVHPDGSAVLSAEGLLLGVVNQGILNPLDNTLIERVETMMREDKVIRAYLGATVSRLDPSLYGYYGQDKGLLIVHREANSTAEMAGLQKGDLLVGLAGHTIRERRDLAQALANFKEDGNISISYIRRGIHKETSFPPAAVDRNILNPNAYEYAGMVMESLSGEIRMLMNIPGEIRGVYVGIVTPGSRGDTAGIKAGDVIIRYNAEDVQSLRELRSRMQPSQKATLSIYRDGWNFMKRL